MGTKMLFEPGLSSAETLSIEIALSESRNNVPRSEMVHHKPAHVGSEEQGMLPTSYDVWPEEQGMLPTSYDHAWPEEQGILLQLIVVDEPSAGVHLRQKQSRRGL